MGSVIAAGTSYATHGTHMIPVYVFYSMFGFQRTGDQMWAFGDQLGRGFLLGATAGRTTLNGEGLQHQDGHSLLLASVSEACVAYDPAFAYELAVITMDALAGCTARRPSTGRQYIFYYLTLYNEPFQQPPAPAVDGLERPPARHLPVLAAHRRRPRRHRGRRSWPPASRCRGRWPRSSCSPRTGASRPTCGRSPRGTSCTATAWPRAAQPAASGRAGAGTVRDDGAVRPPGPVVAVSDCMRAVPDLIARWVPRRTPRSAPTGSASPIPGRPPAGSSTWTRSRSCSRCSPSSRRPARCTRRCRPRRSRSTGSTCRSRRRSARAGSGSAGGTSRVPPGPRLLPWLSGQRGCGFARAGALGRPERFRVSRCHPTDCLAVEAFHWVPA